MCPASLLYGQDTETDGGCQMSTTKAKTAVWAEIWLAGYFVLGLGYGIYVQSLGLPVWMPMLMGTVVYGGSLEFVLPAAIFGMLIVYCLKSVTPFAGSRGIPEAIALLVTIGLHKWKHETLLSVAGGTVCYVLLVQLVF